jgi:tricarballylate dehydrogenase
MVGPIAQNDCMEYVYYVAVPGSYDVIVVGAGNAGLSAGHAASERGADVLVLEKAPRARAGGNTYFTAGAMRLVHEGLGSLRGLLAASGSERRDITDLGPYTAEDYHDDMLRLTGGRCEPVLTDVLVRDAADIGEWLRSKGVRFELLYDRQAYLVNGRWRFWGGLAVGSEGGGIGLVRAHLEAAARRRIDVLFDSAVTDIERRGGQWQVRWSTGTERHTAGAPALVLAAGGFQASKERRARHLGDLWTAAKVRGSPYNTGEILELALLAGAAPHGDWRGCHAIAWDAEAPDTGSYTMTNRFSRQAYPFAIVVNSRGERFIDEGADFRNLTYARYGREILAQPEARAFQVFDAKTRHLISPIDYGPATCHEADSLERLAAAAGIDPRGFCSTVARYNSAVRDGHFDPTIKDGCRTEGLTPPKSHWALRIDTPPYVAYPVTCGLTFTFGGVRIDERARVLSTHGEPLPGLHAAGEMVGGLFFDNYPGGSGLTAGSVFGRRAGRSAAEQARWG